MTTDIETVAETGSTNDDMMARARQGAAEGLWIRAGRQVRGRGRQGRTWSSDPGNLAASTLVRVRAGDPSAATLALVAAVALQDVLATIAPDAAIRIKWPNDLTIGDAKLSGILLERVADAVVIGFGVNLASAPVIDDRIATSLMQATGVGAEPAVVVAMLAETLARWIAVWRQYGLKPVRARWLAVAHPVGTALRVRTGVDPVGVDGLFEGLDRDGGLLLRTVDGVRTVHAGDVFLI